MEKLCVGPVAAGQVDIRDTPTENLRPHRQGARPAGQRHHRGHPRAPPARRPHRARSGRRAPGSSSSATATCRRPSRAPSPGTGVHAVMGTGGAPEGVITAAALRCLGGEIQARFRYRSDDERERGARMGHGDEDRVYLTEDLAPGENLVFAATGVTAGDLLQGVPLLRRRRADALAGDGLPGQAGPLRRHCPHVRPRQPAAGPALGRRWRLRTRLQGVRRAVPAAPAARPRDRGRSGPGFDSVWTSDHFQPWRHTDGHAPNALVWLGAAAQATERVDARHERPDAVVPLQPRGRRPGVRDARLPGARPGRSSASGPASR